MKFALAGEHKEFFQKNQAIEFEDLLTESQIKNLEAGVNHALSKRLGVPVALLSQTKTEKLCEKGRDVWRENAAVKKISTSHHLAEIAAELMHEKALRLGYDQLLAGGKDFAHKGKGENLYKNLLESPRSLSEISCFQGIACGLILCLKGSDANEGQAVDRPEHSAQAFPFKPGSGTYISPSYPIPFPALAHRQGQSFLMIVYTRRTAVYVVQEGDPHLHDLKRHGYVFGDRLNDKLNPIVFR